MKAFLLHEMLSMSVIDRKRDGTETREQINFLLVSRTTAHLDRCTDELPRRPSAAGRSD